VPKKTRIEWNADDLRRAIEQAPETWRQTMVAYLYEMTNRGKVMLFEATPGKAGGEGNLASSWQAVVNPNGRLGVVVSSVNYAYWVEHGRGPGKMPPYDNIERWVHRLGLGGGRASGEEREEAHAAQGAHQRTAYKPQPERKARPEKRGDHDDTRSREDIIQAIRRSIAIYGTEPTNFVAKTQKRFAPIARKRYEDYVAGFAAALSSGG